MTWTTPILVQSVSATGVSVEWRRFSDGQLVTTQNLLVHLVDAENGVLLIKGAIPGRTGGLVVVRSAIKRGEK